MDTNYERILNGKKLDLTSRPYNIKFIDKMINFYEEKEEYEKCEVIHSFKKELLDHENNYLLKQQS
jgi:hypothetical protein